MFIDLFSFLIFLVILFVSLDFVLPTYCSTLSHRNVLYIYHFFLDFSTLFLIHISSFSILCGQPNIILFFILFYHFFHFVFPPLTFSIICFMLCLVYYIVFLLCRLSCILLYLYLYFISLINSLISSRISNVF
jgi:hypothetical protein